jgi:hypothetical protein
MAMAMIPTMTNTAETKATRSIGNATIIRPKNMRMSPGRYLVIPLSFPFIMSNPLSNMRTHCAAQRHAPLVELDLTII